MRDDSPALWRVFCAIDVTEPARQLVLRHIARLREAVRAAKASWSRDANLHLTLKFLGEITQHSVAGLSRAASKAVAGLTSFSIRLEETGVFPTHGQPRVLWIGIKDSSEQLVELHKRLEDQSAREGFANEERPFHPHLTIARVRQPQQARSLAAEHQRRGFEPTEIAVSELLVIRSELSSEGSRYSIVSRHVLVGSDKD